MLSYHHSRDLQHVTYGLVSPEKYSPADSMERDILEAFAWLGESVGFYPLFLSVGVTEDDIRVTGYQSQWNRWTQETLDGRVYRRRGEFPNYVLFSFEDIEGVFMDYRLWDVSMLHKDDRKRLTDFIFNPSWTKEEWLKKALDDPGSVQIVTSELYLPGNGRIWVRNQQTKRSLESMGFENIEVKRISVD